MVFLHNDFYTASGSVKLYGCWTDKVTKHDTSSFYNWEEDNLPLYDLDERTYFLWERFGHPTSALPGIVLVVSAGGLAGEYDCNKNLFSNLEDAIDAIPEVLNYPVIIEVCNKGQLGTLNIKNLKCGKLGSLEIVNKCFAKAEPKVGLSSIQNGNTVTNYDLLNVLSAAPHVLSLRQHFAHTKSEFLGKKIFPLPNDLSSVNGSLNGFVIMAGNGYYNRPTYFANSIFELPGYGNELFSSTFAFEYMEAKVPFATQEEVHTKDLSATQEVQNTLLYNNDLLLDFGDTFLLDTKPIVGLFYANQIQRIKVTNCDGPIFIRNFFVDGSGYSFPSNNYGVHISNSENVYLENCVSIRNNKAGFLFDDSKVIITRGIGAYRNYKRPRVTLSSTNYDLDTGAGLLANNSEIYFSSTKEFEQNLVSSDYFFSGLLSGTSSLDYGSNYPLNFCKNANGIILNNSKFYGGLAGSSYTQLTTDVNRFIGIKLNNSNLEWDGGIISLGNSTGLQANNSYIKTDLHTFKHNQDYGINLKDSTLIYNKNLSGYTDNEGTQGLQFSFDKNGVHLKLENSNYYCDIFDGMPNKCGTHRFIDSHKKSNNVNFNLPTANPANSLPSIIVNNSSKCLLIHPFINRNANSVIQDNIPQDAFTPKLGILASITNNSKAIFKGTGTAASILFGPAGEQAQINSVGMLVSDDSSLDLHGPTAIAQLGIDVLAQNNSVLNIGPHTDEIGNLQYSQFNLSSPTNHTKVELHSTRACLVANKNSTINLKDLGSFWQSWKNSQFGLSALASSPDQRRSFNNYFTSGGFLQFYPNPIGIGESDNNNFTLVGLPSPISNPNFFASDYYLFNRANSPENFSGITWGGMCVRAFNNSVVNVQNVNFPCGWWNPSAPFYNADDVGTFQRSLCNKLFIWNIGDNSQLNAAYCSVEDKFPQDAGYHGPNAVWLGSLNKAGVSFGAPISGLPNSTPDTSGLSILDYFGSGPTSGTYSSIFFTSSYQNQGPFRLYFSVDPASYLLNLIDFGATYGSDYYLKDWLYQIYSQGYQPPFSASAVSSASAIHKSLIKGNSRSGVLSGYYYGSAMLHAPDSPRVFLDESAASIFANAKHCSVGKSGLGKVVSIYYPYLALRGSESFFSKDTGKGIQAVNFFDIDRNS